MPAALFTGSSNYTAPNGIGVGVPTGQAETRAHQHATTGCHQGFYIGIGNTRNRAVVLVTVNGGRIVNHMLPNGSTESRIRGRHVSNLQTESNRHPVGLQFC